MTQPRLFEAERHRRRGANTRALGTTLKAMKDAGQLERVDEALVALARTGAGLLDAAVADDDESRWTVNGCLKEHRNTLAILRALAPVGGDELDKLLWELAAPVAPDVPEP